MSEKRQTSSAENFSLNCMKGIACISVVILHCTFPGVVGKILYGWARFAVPFFFAVSGYYAYCENEDVLKSKLNRKVKHIGKYFFATEGIYFIWHIIYSIIVDKSLNGAFEWLQASFTYKNIVNTILFQKTIIGDVSWFLLALLLCYCITFFIGKRNLWKKSCVLILVLFGMNLFIADVVPIVFKINVQWYWISNFYLLGFPSYVLGYWIRINEDKLKAVDLKYYLYALPLAMMLNLIERFITSGSQFFITNIPFVVACIVICLKCPKYNGGGAAVLRYIGKNLSFGVYIFHPIIRDILRLVGMCFAISNLKIWSWTLPILTIMVTLICTEIEYKIRKSAMTGLRK